MSTETGVIWTVARIVERTKASRHQVEYVIRTRGINPIATAGSARVFAHADVEAIQDYLRQIEDDRAFQGGAA